MPSAVRFVFATVLAVASASGAIASAAEGFAASEFLARHAGSEWSGSSELWIDPLGNDTESSDATVRIAPDGLLYTWAFRGEPQRGRSRSTTGPSVGRTPGTRPRKSRPGASPVILHCSPSSTAIPRRPVATGTGACACRSDRTGDSSCR